MRKVYFGSRLLSVLCVLLANFVTTGQNSHAQGCTSSEDIPTVHNVRRLGEYCQSGGCIFEVNTVGCGRVGWQHIFTCTLLASHLLHPCVHCSAASCFIFMAIPCACGLQFCHHLCIRRDIQWSKTSAVLGVDFGPRTQQCTDNIYVAVDGCIVQGSVSVAAGMVDVGAVPKQEGSDVGVAVVAGLVERCPPRVVLRIDRCPFVDQL